MEKKKLTKSDVTVSDAVYIIFTIVIAFCFIACAVVSLFIIASGCVWLVKSFQVESGYVVRKSITSYLKERKELLADLEKEEESNS